MIIRGPGVPSGVVSKIPSTHIDMAPTFLDIAGLTAGSLGYPVFLDGRSLLPEWRSPTSSCSKSVGREILNVEFWGTISNAGLPDYEVRSPTYAYKTVRIVSETSAWLFSRWCNANNTELYNTIVSFEYFTRSTQSLDTN
jgi:N-acetylglucosamine-6-sulfatase